MVRHVTGIRKGVRERRRCAPGDERVCWLVRRPPDRRAVEPHARYTHAADDGRRVVDERGVSHGPSTAEPVVVIKVLGGNRVAVGDFKESVPWICGTVHHVAWP